MGKLVGASKPVGGKFQDLETSFSERNELDRTKRRSRWSKGGREHGNGGNGALKRQKWFLVCHRGEQVSTRLDDLKRFP